VTEDEGGAGFAEGGATSRDGAPAGDVEPDEVGERAKAAPQAVVARWRTTATTSK